MKNRKRSRKELKALHAKKRYKVGPLADPKDWQKGNFLSMDAPNALGGTRPLLAGDSPVSKENQPISKGKTAILRHRKLLRRA
jgi:hypothetical protein